MTKIERRIRLDEARLAFASVPEYNVGAKDALERRINELEGKGKKTGLQQLDEWADAAEKKRQARIADPSPPASGEKFRCKHCGHGTNSLDRVCLPCAVL